MATAYHELDTFTCTILNEFDRIKFTSIVSPQNLQLLARLSLDAGLELHDRRRRVCLGPQECEPHIAAHIIYQQQEVGVPGWC